MARLFLTFDGAVLQEITLTQSTLTIGRLPDNTLPIENLAVSGHHAKIYWEQGHYVIEDLGSLNGTYVNHQRINKTTLVNGDQVVIGKHLVQFKDEGPKPAGLKPEKSGPAVPKLEETVLLDTKQAQEMIAAKAAGGAMPAQPGAPHAKERTGMLSVLEGKTDQHQYVLTSKATMIGKSDMASIKLKGFFAPTTAALISRRDSKYFIAAAGNKVSIKINGQDVAGQRELAEGDILEVAGIKAAFSLQE
ncbi:MAG TPA: FHA domain-containing protein [Candidatus Angelobacter sp.]|nr:FHA domain-containing protein [Candidatus Angelobacter sp.]